MKIACIGYGNIGGALARGFRELGHEVVLVAHDPRSAKLARVLAGIPGVVAAQASEALAGAEVVILAIPFPSCRETLPPLASLLSGKILVDCTNPVGPGLAHGLESRSSGAEAIQRLVPAARVVKAFNVYGFENLPRPVDAQDGIRSMMPIAGDDPSAKDVVAGLVEALGWEALDTGGLPQALHLEHMTLLWVRMVRVDSASAHLTWAKRTGALR